MTQTIAIIGAGPGISRAVAHQFGREGYRVVLIGRTESTLNDLVTELRQAGVSATAVVADASPYQSGFGAESTPALWFANAGASKDT